MTDVVIIQRADKLLGLSFEDMPCYKLLAVLVDPFPPDKFQLVGLNWLQIGDMVSFDDTTPDVYSTIGVYLGSDKIIVSLPGHGVRLMPFRYIRQHFLWGGRNG